MPEIIDNIVRIECAVSFNYANDKLSEHLWINVMLVTLSLSKGYQSLISTLH